jgi:hypothetical protein
VHSSTVALLDELGLGAEFRQLPQSKMTGLLLLPGAQLRSLRALAEVKKITLDAHPAVRRHGLSRRHR